MVSDADRAEILAECERVLRTNWREGLAERNGTPFAYTCPATGHYPWQWYWDSCFAAIAWRHWDRSRSRLELESLLSAQREDGFIGHTIFWNTPLTGPRRITYNITEHDPFMTASIQPPLLAWAWSMAVGDPTREPRIVQHHRWLEANRELDGDGLISIVQPDESGLDTSPQFDPIWGRRAHAHIGFLRLLHFNRQRGYDAHAIARDGGQVTIELATNVLYSLSRSAMGLGSLTDALIDRCWDESRGWFTPVWRRGSREFRGGPLTWAALAPLALDDLPEAIGRRMIEEHLLNPDEFLLPAGPPSVAANAEGFRRRETPVMHKYWRGPMWINAAWMLWRGCVRLGYQAEADDLITRVARSVITSGLREYYEPYTGAGMGQRNFSWSAVVAEML